MASTTIEAITQLLFLEDHLDGADLLFVFGNDWLPTMDVVSSLYSTGRYRKVLISGHSARKDREKSEASRFMERGLELGMPSDAFLLEHNATNTKENLEFSLPIIEAHLGLNSVSSVVFVCKTFHTRRVLMTARKYLPAQVKFGFVPMLDERNIGRDNWWNDSVSVERVVAELRRIAEYTLKGDLSIQ